MLSELDNNGDRKVSFDEFVDNMALICSAVFSQTGDAQDNLHWRWKMPQTPVGTTVANAQGLGKSFIE